MSIKITPPQYTLSVITALKKYLSPFRIDDKPVPLHVKGYTREHDTPSFPYFFVEKFGLARDMEQFHSGLKDTVVEKDGLQYFKKNPVPYRLSFVLEYADSNPVNYQSVSELLYAKLEREPYLVLEFGKSDIENCPLYVESVHENEYSDINHRLFSLSILIQLDPTNELVEDETIDRLIVNGIYVEINEDES